MVDTPHLKLVDGSAVSDLDAEFVPLAAFIRGRPRPAIFRWMLRR